LRVIIWLKDERRDWMMMMKMKEKEMNKMIGEKTWCDGIKATQNSSKGKLTNVEICGYVIRSKLTHSLTHLILDL
jgi:hypothetical protein